MGFATGIGVDGVFEDMVVTEEGGLLEKGGADLFGTRLGGMGVRGSFEVIGFVGVGALIISISKSSSPSASSSSSLLLLALTASGPGSSCMTSIESLSSSSAAVSSVGGRTTTGSCLRMGVAGAGVAGAAVAVGVASSFFCAFLSAFFHTFSNSLLSLIP